MKERQVTRKPDVSLRAMVDYDSQRKSRVPHLEGASTLINL